MYRVEDYISSGLDSKIVDPDGAIHENRLRAQKAKEKNTTPVLPSSLPSEGWTSSLQQLPPFNYGCLYAHLVTGLQVTGASGSCQAGAMKHKEAGYRLFKDNHVMMVRFNPANDNFCIFHAYVKPSFKNTGKYSTIVALAKSSGHVAGAKCNCKAGGGGCCKHVAALLYNILDYTELGLNEIPPDKTCTELPQQWHKPKNITYNGPALFSEIQFVHHVYGKRKAEECALRMEKLKKYRACPSNLSIVTEERIRKLCTSLEADSNAVPFTTVMRNNDYKPLSSSTSPFSASPSCASPSSPASPSTIEHNSISRGDSATSAATPEEKVWEEVNVTSDQAKHIESITRAQADSVEWHYERSIRITASFFGRVCRRLPTTTSDCLVNSIVNFKNYQSMPVACAWGKNNESKARDAYIENMKMTGHSNLEVFESGLVVNIKYSFLGASPDGVYMTQFQLILMDC